MWSGAACRARQRWRCAAWLTLLDEERVVGACSPRSVAQKHPHYHARRSAYNSCRALESDHHAVLGRIEGDVAARTRNEDRKCWRLCIDLAAKVVGPPGRGR